MWMRSGDLFLCLYDMGQINPMDCRTGLPRRMRYVRFSVTTFNVRYFSLLVK
jgi:hypothetical protein